MDGDEMQQSKEVSVNWLRINVPSIISIVVAAVTMTMYIQRLETRLDVMEQSQQQRAAASDKNSEDIRQQLQQLSTLPYRMNVVESGLTQTNQRMDQYLQTLGAKIDGMGDRVNSLSTKVEVLSQKIDALTPQKRAELGVQQAQP